MLAGPESRTIVGTVASDRALLALRMRQNGETYRAIADHLGVSQVRARQLVCAAVRKEPGFRTSEAAREAALDSIFLLDPDARKRLR